MKTIINEIISIRSRVSQRDIKAIYLAAICDIALGVILLSGILFIALF